MPIRNIVVYSQTLPPENVGGIETNAFYLIRYLVRSREFNLGVYTATKRKFFFRRTRKVSYGDATFILHVMRKKDLAGPQSLGRMLMQAGYLPQETVVFHNSLDLHRQYACLKSFGFKQVARSGGNDLLYLQKKEQSSQVLVGNLQHLDVLFLNSDYSLKRSLEIGLSADSLKVIKGGCEPNSSSRLGDSAPFPKDKPVILTCGRLVDFKGLDDALHAIALLNDKGIALRYVIVGEGEQCDALKRQALTLGISEICCFVGKISPAKMHQYYENADIYLSTSKDVTRLIDGFEYVHTETMGRSICEAQACGLPVVSTDAGGTGEMLYDQKTGIVVPQRSVDQIASAIEQLLENVDLRDRMAKEAREFALHHLSWNAVLNQYVDAMRALA